MPKIIKMTGLLLCLLTTSCGVTSESGGRLPTSSDQSSTPTENGYVLDWADEFDDASLNEENWNYLTGDGSSYGNPGWGNNEQQYYKRDNTRLEDGKLVITAKKEQVGNKKYTSSRLSTAGKVSAKYGRIEACISMPLGQGLWPAFWMLPEADTPYGGWAASGEIDIMEARGRVEDMTSGALHYGAQNASTYQTKTNIFRGETINEYHVYALEWEENEMRWYADDNNFMTITSDRWFTMAPAGEDSETAPFDWDFHILLNMAVGGNFDGGVEPVDSFVSAEMKVDYVRIYKKAN